MPTFQISDSTKAFLQTSFFLPRLVDNKTRKSWLLKYGQLEGDETQCLKLDSIIWGERPKEALETDQKLSQLQNFVLDAVGPLIAAYNELTSRDNLDPNQILLAVQQGLCFLKNTAAHFSKERRSRALAHSPQSRLKVTGGERRLL